MITLLNNMFFIDDKLKKKLEYLHKRGDISSEVRLKPQTWQEVKEDKIIHNSK